MANKAVQGRWLRHKKDGTIYPYLVAMANNPAVEEVSEKEAFPERFMTKKQKTRKTKLDLSTDGLSVAKAKTPKTKTKPALSADAAKGLGKGKKK